MNSQLVTRRKVGGGKSVVEKHVEDVWLLVCSIKDKNRIPRVLLKNGKRSRKEFEQSQSISSKADNTISCYTSDHLLDKSLTSNMRSSLSSPCQCTPTINQFINAQVNNDLSDNIVPDNYELSNQSAVTSENDQFPNLNPLNAATWSFTYKY